MEHESGSKAAGAALLEVAPTQVDPPPAPVPGGPPGARPRRRRPELWLGAGALLAYLLLGQNAFHGFDAYAYLSRVAAGDLRNAQSALYYPLAVGWSQALGLLAVPLYEALRALSAVAAALGVLAAHRAAIALGVDRPRALCVAATVATLPAVAHTASVVEIDAIVFALACLSWWPFARLLRGGPAGFALLVSACTAAAAMFHAAGHLLVVSLCGWNLVWDLRRRALPRALWTSTLILGAHAALALPLAAALGAGAGQAVMATNTAALPWRLDLLPTTAWREWLLPYLLPGVLAFGAARLRPWRGATLGLAIVFAVYLLVTTRILGTFESTASELPRGALDERGAFLLALALPFGLLSCLVLPLRAAWLLAGAGAVISAVEIQRRDWPADPPGFAAGYAQVEQRTPLFLLVADARELAWLCRRHPGARCASVATLELQARERAAQDGRPVPAELLRLALVVRARQEASVGRALALTAGALARLRRPADDNWQAAIEQLEREGALRAISDLGFAAWQLDAR